MLLAHQHPGVGRQDHRPVAETGSRQPLSSSSWQGSGTGRRGGQHHWAVTIKQTVTVTAVMARARRQAAKMRQKRSRAKQGCSGQGFSTANNSSSGELELCWPHQRHQQQLVPGMAMHCWCLRTALVAVHTVVQGSAHHRSTCEQALAGEASQMGCLVTAIKPCTPARAQPPGVLHCQLDSSTPTATGLLMDFLSCM